MVKSAYMQVVESIARKIETGEYKPGDELPTYDELAKIYEVGRTSIVRAIGILHDRGLTVGVPGKGTFVAKVAKT